MELVQNTKTNTMLFTVLIWGGLWGIFEATVGYLLHLLPFSVGWLIWYPVACFFMYNVYRRARRIEAVVFVGVLSACIKLLNLFLPGRIDRVLNPAVSIVFEALALAAVLWVANRFFAEKKRNHLVKALSILCMNVGWRLLYALYLLLLVPDWIREVSVISSAQAMFTFFVVHNLSTSLLLFIASYAEKTIFRPIESAEKKMAASLATLPYRSAAYVRIAAAVCLLGSSIALDLLI